MKALDGPPTAPESQITWAIGGSTHGTLYEHGPGWRRARCVACDWFRWEPIDDTANR